MSNQFAENIFQKIVQDAAAKVPVDDESGEEENEEKVEVKLERKITPLVLPQIDFADNFDITVMRAKASECDYLTDEEVIQDCGKLTRFVDEKMLFLFKSYDATSHAYLIKLKTRNEMKSLFSSICLNYGEKDYHTVWHVFEKFFGYFGVMGIEFSGETKPKFFNIFRGFHYQTNEEVNLEIVQPFLEFVGETI
jgi:hypothetical protein